MKEAEKRALEALRREESIKNMYYNRYLLVRYAVQFFFFVNLYWFLACLLAATYAASVLPFLLLVLAGLAMWEQAQMRRREQKAPKGTMFFFRMSLLTNSLLLIFLLLGQGGQVFPFLNVQGEKALLLAGIQFLGLVASIFLIKKLEQIQNKTDRTYQRIEAYLAVHYR